MCVNNLPKVATQWNSGATRESNRGHRVRIPSALTTRPLSHTTITDTVRCLLVANVFSNPVGSLVTGSPAETKLPATNSLLVLLLLLFSLITVLS